MDAYEAGLGHPLPGRPFWNRGLETFSPEALAIRNEVAPRAPGDRGLRNAFPRLRSAGSGSRHRSPGRVEDFQDVADAHGPGVVLDGPAAEGLLRNRFEVLLRNSQVSQPLGKT